MRYVILRDDDVNALTPAAHLERLYRPFLDRGCPVNLALIPEVATGTSMADGRPEGFLSWRGDERRECVPIGENPKLVDYLRENSGYQIVQHGYRHDWHEFNRSSRTEIARRLSRGGDLITQAGFPKPQTFVPPYDSLSRAGLIEVSRRFRLLSTGWYEWRRLPRSWWPRYALKKARRAPHWRVGQTVLLSHPGCLLSYVRPVATMLDSIIAAVNARRLTVLVTHWWEYFRDGRPDETLIGALHETAEYLTCQREVRVTSFAAAAAGEIPLQ